MWTVAGLLLGFVVIATLLGFHVGPHSHLVAGALGVVAAAWLLVMAANGYASHCSGSLLVLMSLCRPDSDQLPCGACTPSASPSMFVSHPGSPGPKGSPTPISTLMASCGFGARRGPPPRSTVVSPRGPKSRSSSPKASDSRCGAKSPERHSLPRSK